MDTFWANSHEEEFEAVVRFGELEERFGASVSTAAQGGVGGETFCMCCLGIFLGKKEGILFFAFLFIFFSRVLHCLSLQIARSRSRFARN